MSNRGRCGSHCRSLERANSAIVRLGDVGSSYTAGDRRSDIGIAKIDLRGPQGGLVAQYLAFCLLVRSDGLIDEIFGTPAPVGSQVLITARDVQVVGPK